MFKKLMSWLKSTQSTALETTWEARFWALIGIIGIFYSPLSSSIAVVFFMSAWANAKAASIQRREAEKAAIDEELCEKCEEYHDVKVSCTIETEEDCKDDGDG